MIKTQDNQNCIKAAAATSAKEKRMDSEKIVLIIFVLTLLVFRIESRAFLEGKLHLLYEANIADKNTTSFPNATSRLNYTTLFTNVTTSFADVTKTNDTTIFLNTTTSFSNVTSPPENYTSFLDMNSTPDRSKYLLAER